MENQPTPTSIQGELGLKSETSYFGPKKLQLAQILSSRAVAVAPPGTAPSEPRPSASKACRS